MRNETRPIKATRFNFLVLLIASVVWLFLNILHINQKQKDALSYGEQAVEQVLSVQDAILRYVEADQKPAAYALMETSHLGGDYFDPRILSGTFIARRVQEELNNGRISRGLEPLIVKLAAVNARNPINEATHQEAMLLSSFNQGEIDQHIEVRKSGNEDSFYAAIPMFKLSESCMRCHGDPKDAPKQLIEKYGSERAFGKQIGEIPALITIEVPLTDISKISIGDKLAFAGQSGVLIALLALPFIYFNNVIANKNRKLAFLSETDPLTLLMNRRAFTEVLDGELSRAKRYQLDLSLLMFDLDRFKHVNDNYGHNIGDEVLSVFAQILRDETRDTDFASRWGGEEFVVLLTETDLPSATQYAEKIRHLFKQADLSVNLTVTTSIGIAQFNHSESKKTLFQRLDKALYAAKRLGRDRVELANG